MSVRVLSGAVLAGVLLLASCSPGDGESPTGAATTVTSTDSPSPATTSATPPSVTSAPGEGTPSAVAPVPPPGDGDVAVLEGRIAALVKDVRPVGDAYRVTVDLVRFLIGDEAAEAARERGDEDPPPNDYYVVNDDPTLHALPVQAGTSVRLLMDVSGELCGDIAVGCPPMPVAEWAAALAGASGGALRSMPYWMTVSGGMVTAIEQQYIP
jgi:hypothetical protein